MRVLASALGLVTAKSRSQAPVAGDTGLRFPWGVQVASPDLSQLSRRERHFLRYVFSLPQPQRGIAILRLLGIQKYRTRRQRLLTLSSDLSTRFTRAHLAESMRRIVLKPIGTSSTSNTSN